MSRRIPPNVVGVGIKGGEGAILEKTTETGLKHSAGRAYSDISSILNSLILSEYDC